MKQQQQRKNFDFRCLKCFLCFSRRGMKQGKEESVHGQGECKGWAGEGEMKRGNGGQAIARQTLQRLLLWKRLSGAQCNCKTFSYRYRYTKKYSCSSSCTQIHSYRYKWRCRCVWQVDIYDRPPQHWANISWSVGPKLPLPQPLLLPLTLPRCLPLLLPLEWHINYCTNTCHGQRADGEAREQRARIGSGRVASRRVDSGRSQQVQLITLFSWINKGAGSRRKEGESRKWDGKERKGAKRRSEHIVQVARMFDRLNFWFDGWVEGESDGVGRVMGSWRRAVEKWSQSR